MSDWLCERISKLPTSELWDLMQPEDTEGDNHANDCSCPNCIIWREMGRRLAAITPTPAEKEQGK